MRTLLFHNAILFLIELSSNKQKCIQIITPTLAIIFNLEYYDTLNSRIFNLPPVYIFILLR